MVPIGCSGSDRVYPSNTPFAKGGRVVYRIGERLRIDGPELAAHRVTEPFRPFTLEAADRHRASFQGMTDVVMDHINRLLDPRYQFAEDSEPEGERGTARFI